MNKKIFVKKIDLILKQYGFDFKKFKESIKHSNDNWFKNDFKTLIAQKASDNLFEIYPNFPILNEKTEEGGTMKGHYFHQDLYVARKIFENFPKKHVDIGSRVDGFVAHVASYREILIYDIRKIESKVKNIHFVQADLMQFDEKLKNSTDSISCLHAIEHFGLGRYGDTIDYWGYLKGLNNIYEILETGGLFYFSVPMGPQRIEFNAHRVFSTAYLVNLLTEKYDILEFSYVNDQGDFFENVALTRSEIENNYGCFWGCGIFVLRKK